MILTIIAIQPFAKVVVHRRPLVWRQLVLKNLPRDKANRKRRNIWMNNKTVYINKIELHNHCTKHAFTANNKLDTAIFMISLKKPTAYRPVQFAILSGKLKLLSIFFLHWLKTFHSINYQALKILILLQFQYSLANYYYCRDVGLLTTRFYKIFSHYDHLYSFVWITYLS